MPIRVIRNCHCTEKRACLNCKAEAIWAKYADPNYYTFRVNVNVTSTLRGFENTPPPVHLTLKERQKIRAFKSEVELFNRT